MKRTWDIDVMEIPVMIDPDTVKDANRLPGRIARIALLPETKEYLVVYFMDIELYNVYRAEELLVLLPPRIIFKKLCAGFRKLKSEDIQQVCNVVSSIRRMNYEDAFRLVTENPALKNLCLTDSRSILHG